MDLQEELKKILLESSMDSYKRGNLDMIKMILTFIDKTPNCTAENVIAACNTFEKELNANNIKQTY